MAVLAAVPIASQASSRAVDELAATGAASGGSAWAGFGGLMAVGREHEDGFDCHFRTVIDLRNGEGRKTVHCPLFTTARGIDARGAWREDRSGWVHALNSPEARTLTVTDRWLNREGPLFPKRGSVRYAPLKAQTLHHVTYRRIAATPADGRTVTVWLGGAQGLIARTVMLRSFEVTTINYGDYRRVRGLMLPYRITSQVGADAPPQEERVDRYELLKAVPSRLLHRPAEPLRDARIPAQGTRIPLTFSPGGKLLVEARINGRGPFPFVLDSGGHAILTPATADQLGLKASGRGVSYGAGAGSTALRFAKVRSIGLGAARIADQPVLVMPLSPVMTDRGDKAPVAGLLGLEVFERFAVTIDPANRTITLKSFDAFKPPAGASVIHLFFTKDMPLIEARLDGKRGLFGLDTGNSGPLMLFPDWAARSGLARYYAAGVPEQDGGEGGMFTAHVAYIHSLRIGGLSVPGQLLGMLTPHGVGSTSNPSEAGNLGTTVWRSFQSSLDYHNQSLYLVPRRHYTPPRPPTAFGGFMAVKFTPNAFSVIRVTPHGPAARAGLKLGEKIVAVNGVNAKRLASLALIMDVKKNPPGTALRLSCRDGRTVTVVLASNAAMQRALHPQLH